RRQTGWCGPYRRGAPHPALPQRGRETRAAVLQRGREINDRDDTSFPMDRRPLGQPASLGDRRAGAAGPGSGTIALTVTQISITVERTGQADHEARGI